MSTGDIARKMGVVHGTATVMMKALAAQELINYELRAGVRLTEKGKELALNIIRRHRLLEFFLVEKLGLDWSEIHDEAEELEHVISDRVVEKLDAFLGFPKADPHGDPIPSGSGRITSVDTYTLLECPINQSLEIARISDQSKPFLQFLSEQDLLPGSFISVSRRYGNGDIVYLQSGEKSIALDKQNAGKILVKSATKS